ncbi:hypothetical protein JAAARDRAFT_42246 [Jaapia argillacea MUCL 33604]|uniref:Uncharacterized protein n=1 Tax=Jaapia argillacea MUCL 33604 TaxID=933084 RepID=A0A067P625_9AGAM|nr:hypothetical protein JAAARDRAFT_42246 [Jaapia argillacea MUCL 33604]
MPILPTQLDLVSTYASSATSDYLLEAAVYKRNAFIAFFVGIWNAVKNWFDEVNLDMFTPMWLFFKDKGEIALEYLARHQQKAFLVGVSSIIVVLSIFAPFVLKEFIHMIGLGLEELVRGTWAAYFQTAVLGAYIAKGFSSIADGLGRLPPIVSIIILLGVAGLVSFGVYLIYSYFG